MSHFDILCVFSLLFCVSNAREISNRNKIQTRNGELCFAFVIFRHGDRNPVRTYPNDPWKFWPEGLGQLTNVGIQQEYNLGLYLHDRYRTLLGNFSYSNDLVYVQNVDRTLMSAEAVMAAMFPPVDTQIWNENLLWQPIPIHSTLSFDENLCPRFQKAQSDYFNSTEMLEFLAKYKQLFEYLEENAGTPIQTIDQAAALYDTLWIEQLKNKTLPEWTKPVLVKDGDFERVALEYFKRYTCTPEMARLSTGFLIRDILNLCSEKIKHSLQPDRSLWIYSAHDTTIANILNSLGHFNGQRPSYSSSLHFELYKSRDAFYLQISYRNSDDEVFLKFPKCGLNCSIEDLRAIIEDIIPTGSFEDECQIPLYVEVVEVNNLCGPDNCIISFIFVITIVPVVAILFCLIWFRRQTIIKTDSNIIEH